MASEQGAGAILLQSQPLGLRPARIIGGIAAADLPSPINNPLKASLNGVDKLRNGGHVYLLRHQLRLLKVGGLFGHFCERLHIERGFNLKARTQTCGRFRNLRVLLYSKRKYLGA